ncbi:TNF receptor-associated factor 5-like [Ochlerotatus camptorhynchus]|uniref:TNF receptor-associated factor 5-like n=1 Tax=Ochlerotatus camptorhynchus TaxID=644619 RepID=UPI0031D8CA94
MSAKSTTVKFNKASCYYCNEWFENNEIEPHIAACGQVLQKCSNGCGVYVALKDMDRHLNRCPAGFGEQLPANQEKTLELEQEIIALRGTLNDEIRQRLALITDIGQLKKRTQLGDEWTAKVGDVLNKLKKVINEETDSRCVDVERCKVDINGLMKQFERIEAWRLELTTRFNQIEGQLKKEVEVDGDGGKPKDAKMVMIESRLNYLQSEVENLRLAQKPPQQIQAAQSNGSTGRNSAAIGELESKMETVDLVLEDHHSSIRIFQEQVKKQMFELRGEMDPMRLVIQEQLDKQAKLDYELKSVLNTVNETEDASEKTQKTLEKYRRETYYTKQSLDDLQVHLQHQDKLVVIQNTQGHLIWRIDQFDKRFKESQQSEFMMKSPMFSNKPFGYTLRLEASLNGVGTWRGRNMIVGLVVVGGYYDNLLEWPCVLSGMIALRDQPQDRSKAAVDYSRSILARRKHQNYEKNQYIHIPHQVLRSEHYIRDDAIFVEVRIDQ